MNIMGKYTALTVRLALFITFALGGSAVAQSIDSKKVTALGGNVQTVDSRQSGAWTVGIDPAQNTVQLPNTESAPLPVKVVGSGTARTPFQRRVIVTPLGTGFQTAFLTIPAGKRLVIENISAIARNGVGQRMEMNFFTYYDNGAGEGGIEAITFHRIPLIDQGVFSDVAIASASYKTLIFADSQIGNQSYQVGVQVYKWINGAWVFDGPVANLYADDNYRGLVGTHYRGPYWESNSGSRVKGQNAIPCVVDPTAIPWLRLEAATPTEGDGIFSRVTYIQRVNTTGGLKPADGGKFEGEVRKVPYTTEYYFYRASN